MRPPLLTSRHMLRGSWCCSAHMLRDEPRCAAHAPIGLGGHSLSGGWNGRPEPTEEVRIRSAPAASRAPASALAFAATHLWALRSLPTSLRRIPRWGCSCWYLSACRSTETQPTLQKIKQQQIHLKAWVGKFLFMGATPRGHLEPGFGSQGSQAKSRIRFQH